MRVYTFGYQGLTMGAIIQKLAEVAGADGTDFNDGRNSGVALVDCRLSPRSRAPGWNARQFEAACNEQAEAGVLLAYYHFPEFGNLNYNRPGAGIRLANPEQGIERLYGLWELGYGSVALMCVCPDWTTCHRREVVMEVRGSSWLAGMLHPYEIRSIHWGRTDFGVVAPVFRQRSSRSGENSGSDVQGELGLEMKIPRIRYD